MKANKSRFSLIAAILTVALMFSLFTLSAFAETETESGTVATETGTATETETGTATETSKEESTTAKETSTQASTTESNSSQKKEDRLATIISLSILGVIVVVITIICIVKREKVAKLFRSLKSESHKVVWFPWDQVRKNTLVVIIVVAIFAIAIGILDFAFSKGIIAFGELFN